MKVSKTLTVATALGAVCLATASQAAIVASYTTDFTASGPYPSDPAFETFDLVAPGAIDTSRSQSGTRELGQTFQLSDPITTVQRIFLAARITTSLSTLGEQNFTVRVSAVDDFNADPFATGPIIKDIAVSVTAPAVDATTDALLQIDLTGTDVFALPARGDLATFDETAYAITLLDASTGGDTIFFWAIDTQTVLSGGQAYNDTNPTVIRNGGTFGVAFVAVPEPASLALVGLGGLMMLSRRRSA